MDQLTAMLWSRATEQQIADKLAGEQHQADEHDKAVERLAELAADGDEQISRGVVIRPRRADGPSR